MWSTSATVRRPEARRPETIAPHGPRRHTNPEFQQEFRRNPLLQVRFAAAIAAISRCRSAGNRGLPRGLDFQRQNNWKPFRCHRMSVAGFTTVRIGRQSISHDSATSAIRVASSARRGFTCRSTYNASCVLRNKFSAASCAFDRTAVESNRRRSQAMRRMVRSAAPERDLAIVAGS